jgi:hypothetical protein
VKVTNELGISLPLAVWLLTDDYDYVTGVENYYSVTTLQKPLRQILLPGRIPYEEQRSDVADYIARKLGHAIHDSMERSWTTDQYKRSLKLLGHPDSVIEQIAVNPTDEERRASNSMIPVYLEQRMFRKITVDGKTYTIGGKYDMVADGIIQDTKSTSAWAFAKGTKDDDHKLQMSLYRWLDRDCPLPRIVEDYGEINFIFTDWSKAMLKSAGYPQKRVETKQLPLLPLSATEDWLIAKLRLIEKYRNVPEVELPECTDEELWRSAPQYKYFADPAKASDPNARSTKNFDDLVEARKFQAEKGGKGVIITKPGEVKACGYCGGFDACTQKDRYL